MPCYKPVNGYRKPNGQWTGKDEDFYPPMTRPCGYCVGCRFRHQQQWTTRCLHEEKMHNETSSFITLTYNPKNLPAHAGLDYTHWQKFIRSLKKRNKGKSIRYYAVGEYGENFGRPHFHAILFGHHFDDKVPTGKKNLYKSNQLLSAWCTSNQEPRGYVSVGDVTPESISYVCGYVQKKIYGQQQGSHYKYIDLESGEITPYKPTQYEFLRAPEKAFMSRRPGIGSTFYKKYHSDMYRMNNNCVHINGKEVAVPTYYNNKFKKDNPAEWLLLQQQKEENMRIYTPEALIQHEKTFKARMSIYKRGKLK
jgi:tRNA(Ile)-lysidine synthase TilS/MesJ